MDVVRRNSDRSSADCDMCAEFSRNMREFVDASQHRAELHALLKERYRELLGYAKDVVERHCGLADEEREVADCKVARARRRLSKIELQIGR